MSRSYYWDWEYQFVSLEDALEMRSLWDWFFMECPLPVKYVESGGSVPGMISVLLYANRTKAKRLAADINKFFDRTGTLTRSLM